MAIGKISFTSPWAAFAIGAWADFFTGRRNDA